VREAAFLNFYGDRQQSGERAAQVRVSSPYYNNDRASKRERVNSGERRRRDKVCKTVGSSLPTTLSLTRLRFASALKVTQKQQQPGVNNNLISWQAEKCLSVTILPALNAGHPCAAKWKWPRGQFACTGVDDMNANLYFSFIFSHCLRFFIQCFLEASLLVATPLTVFLDVLQK
jgi:hypothetical protein